MICHHCNKHLPAGLSMCFHCGMPVTEAAPPIPAAPAPTAPAPSAPPGLKQFTPQPLDTKPLHPAVKGTGYVALLSSAAWLAALAGPLISLFLIARGFAALIPALIDGSLAAIVETAETALTDLVESSMLNLLDSIISGQSSGWQIGVDGSLLGSLPIWDTVTGVLGAVQGGWPKFIFGWLLVLAVAVPMLFLMVALRKNVRAARAILIVNLGLCAAGNWLCHTVIKNIVEAIGILQPPYDNIPGFALGAALAAAGLWGVAVVYYFTLAAKGERLEHG